MLIVRQILQSAFVVGWGDLGGFPANFPHGGFRLLGAALPLRGMHKVAGGGRPGNPVRGGGELRPPLPGSGGKRARLCATQRPRRPYGQSLLGLLQRLGGPFLGFLLLSILGFHAFQLGIAKECLKLPDPRETTGWQRVKAAHVSGLRVGGRRFCSQTLCAVHVLQAVFDPSETRRIFLPAGRRFRISFSPGANL